MLIHDVYHGNVGYCANRESKSDSATVGVRIVIELSDEAVGSWDKVLRQTSFWTLLVHAVLL